MNRNDFVFVRSLGYFSDDATREFRTREQARLDDLCGPEMGAIMLKTGWSFGGNFLNGAHAVVTARDQSGKAQAIGWAIETELGLNLSYAVASQHEGKGLGHMVASMAIVEADRQYGGFDNDRLVVHAQWRADNYASGNLAYRLGLQQDAGLAFQVDLKNGPIHFHGASLTAKSAVDMARLYLLANGDPELLPIYSHARFAPKHLASYEVSTAGDKRFSALNARLKDGRTIEEAYQLDVKGYRAHSSDWRAGKGKPGLDPNVDLWVAYKGLWDDWALENPGLIRDLGERAKGKCLTDKFASSPVSQARALAEILNALYEPVEGPELEVETCSERRESFAQI